MLNNEHIIEKYVDVDIFVEMTSFVSQPQSVLKEVECTDKAQWGFTRKNAN